MPRISNHSEQGFSYRWSFSWRADSSDARMRQALRESDATLRYKVASGSIIADAQLGRTPPMAVGACLDPAILAARLTPATDDGRVVRARVEMPVRFVP